MKTTNSHDSNVNIPKELYSSLFYPLKIYKLFGCAPFTFSHNGIEESVTKFWITVVLNITYLSIYCLTAFRRRLQGDESDLELHVFFNSTVTIISITTIWIEAFLTRKKFSILINRMGKIDLEFMKHNIQLNYPKRIRPSMMVFAGQIALPILTWVVMEGQMDYILVFVIYFAPHSILTVNAYIYYEMVNLIRERLNALNNILQSLSQYDHDEISFITTDNRKKRSFHLLCHICKWHHSLVKLITLMNKTFGFRMVSYFGYSFLILAMHSFLICRYVQMEIDFIHLTEYIIISICYAPTVYRICKLSECSIQEVKRAGSLIYEIETLDEDTLDEIAMFSLQIINDEIEFSAAGFFSINHGLLFSIIGGVTTYTIILIQLQTENPDMTSGI